MIAPRLLVLCTAIATTALGAAGSASAVALRPNKATDDSVCDLTHRTNAYLGSKTLVPAVASTRDQTDAYFRLAGQFVIENCQNGQVLMVQGDASDPIDQRSLAELANSSCLAASVSRSDVLLDYAGRARPGFELRCTITKHDELVKKLDELERSDPMESLKARMYKAVRRADGGSSSSNAPSSKASSQSGRDCSKLTFSGIFYRGAPCD